MHNRKIGTAVRKTILKGMLETLQIIILYVLLSLYIPIELGSRVRRSPILTSKLSSSDYFGKFNLKIYYPPPDYCQVWHYQEADTELIRRAIDLFDGKKAFKNTSVDEKVAIFSKSILNILHNFIPHETLLVDDTDLPWLTNKIKNLINEKNTVFKDYYQNSNNLQILNKLKSLQNLLTKSIAESKCNYYSRMADKLHNAHYSTYFPR